MGGNFTRPRLWAQSGYKQLSNWYKIITPVALLSVKFNNENVEAELYVIRVMNRKQINDIVTPIHNELKLNTQSAKSKLEFNV